MKTYIYILFFFGALFLLSCYGKKPEVTGLEGTKLPNFKLLLTDSVTNISTTSSPDNSPVLLFSFNPYCPYCKQQIEKILKNQELLETVQIYMLTNFPFPDTKQFVDSYKLSTYKNIKVGVETTETFTKFFQVPGVPFLAVYGKDHLLKQVFLGVTPIQSIMEGANM